MFTQRWEAWITLISLKSFKTQWSRFCRKHRCTKILHTTGKSAKRCTDLAATGLGRKEEEWQPPTCQRPDVKRLVREEASHTPVRALARTPTNTFQIQQGKERPTFQHMRHQLWLPRAKKRNTQYRWKQRSPYSTISNFKFTEKGKCSQRPPFFLN